MDNIIHFQVEEQEVDYRLDKYLFNKLTDFSFSRSFIQKLIKDKFVFVDEREAKSNYKLKYGQNIEVVMPQPKETEILPENIPLDVLYEDSDLLIVNKPKNMVVHPSKGHITGTLVNAVIFHCKDSLSGINGEIRPGIVHRIDKDTTGSLIICKNDETHIAIAEQIKVHSVKRIYRGILLGHLKEPEGKVEGNIGRHPTDRKKMAIVPEGKSAITHYRVIREFSNASYVEFQLETGRTHQIRVHMASIGHPLLGDVLYGSQKNPYHLAGQALHAMTIGFIHPKTGEYMEVSAPLPEYFEKLLLTLDRS
ncbi:MAG: RluA family pseudouridine synthase [Lachnospiraceae bacterium]|nr:RluA family pseudouridine synthase [Lachnospiraceae bacterium]